MVLFIIFFFFFFFFFFLPCDLSFLSVLLPLFLTGKLINVGLRIWMLLAILCAKCVAYSVSRSLEVLNLETGMYYTECRHPRQQHSGRFGKQHVYPDCVSLFK